MDEGRIWRVALETEETRADHIADLLMEVTGPVSVATGELSEGGPRRPGRWSVEALYNAPPDLDAVRLLLAAGGLDPLSELTVSEIAQRDWVTASLRDLKPVTAGRFHVHGSHDAAAGAGGAIDLLIDAGLAFGTGHHETTTGCLLALQGLYASHRYVRPLDVGTGSGILAIAIARLARVPVLASDIDPVAVRVARANARLNGVAHLTRFAAAPGLRHPVIRRGAPYDLVVANILARPLVGLAGDIAAVTAPGGRVVLSGILNRQAVMVEHAFRQRGLQRAGRLVLGDWTTLVLGR